MTSIPNDLGGHPVLKMDETYHETLKWINRIRRKHGKGGLRKIRKGTSGSRDCPVAMSLKDACPDVAIGRSVYALTGGIPGPNDSRLPEEVRRFISDFDADRNYTELRENAN